MQKKTNTVEHKPDNTSVLILKRKDGSILECVIDTKDYELVKGYRWCAHKEGRVWYVKTTLPRKCEQRVIKMHSLILPDAQEVDHKDHNGLNNRRANLHECLRVGNVGNSRKRIETCTSKFKGVCWDKHRRKWRASIRRNGLLCNLGRFKTEFEAATAYDVAARQHFDRFAYLNFKD